MGIQRLSSKLIKHKESTLYDMLEAAQRKVVSVADLRNLTPTKEGEVVFVECSIAQDLSVRRVGGGFFVAYNNTQAKVDDGGVFVSSPHPTLDWKRTGFTLFDAQFWGIVGDMTTDCTDMIEAAHSFARRERVILDYPQGNILTSRSVPIYDNMGIRGFGSAESTVFYKTTNDPYYYMGSGQIQEVVSALVVFVPESYDRKKLTNASITHRGVIESCMFRRMGLTADNYALNAPKNSIFLGKAAGLTLRNVVAEGGEIGLHAYLCYSSVFDQVYLNTFVGKGFEGVSWTNFFDGKLHLSGTSISLRMVQIQGYQFGFSLNFLQYSSLNDCTVEHCKPREGETVAYAVSMKNPFNITVNNMGTEVVQGGQLQVTLVGASEDIPFRPCVKVCGWLPIDQQNPVAPTPHFLVDSAGLNVPMFVVFESSDMLRNANLANLQKPKVSGQDCKVYTIGCNTERFDTEAGGVYKDCFD